MSNDTNRRTLMGVVSSDACDKSRTVQLERRVRHPKYHKYIKKTTKVHFHDPENQSHIGDKVIVGECRPMSKMKRWELIEVVETVE
jgi:small subunit ribosomal protein S17